MKTNQQEEPCAGLASHRSQAVRNPTGAGAADTRLLHLRGREPWATCGSTLVMSWPQERLNSVSEAGGRNKGPRRGLGQHPSSRPGVREPETKVGRVGSSEDCRRDLLQAFPPAAATFGSLGRCTTWISASPAPGIAPWACSPPSSHLIGTPEHWSGSPNDLILTWLLPPFSSKAKL